MAIVVWGTVLHGDGYGRKLGFPTANLDRRQFVRLQKKSSVKVVLGIYGGTVELPSGKSYKAAMVIGPLDDKGLPKIEAHLLSFHGNLYGKRLIYHFKKYLRPFRVYNGEQDLKHEIYQDIRKIKLMDL